jgi:putative endonuclease
MDGRTLPRQIGARGEAIAARFLEDRGCSIIGRNVRVGSDEIDLVVRDGADVVAVEVKCTTTGDDPLLAVDDEKFANLERAASGHRQRIVRIDIVSVQLNRDGATIRWLRDVE